MSSKLKLIPGRWRLFNLLLLFSLLALSACGDTRETNKQRFLIRGNEALAQQNYREALRLYGEALVIDSCYVPALNNSGIVQFEQRHYTQAILLYDRALICAPDDYDATLNRSNAFYELGELYRAEDDLLYLKKKHADSATIHFRLGLVHAKMKQFSQAVEDFTRTLTLDPGQVEALVNRGTTYYYLGQPDRAVSDLRLALQKDPEEALAYNTLALVAIKQDSLDKAMEMVQSALAFDPDEPYFLNNLGFIQLLQGNIREGRENIDYSIARDPSNAWAYRNKGYYYFLQGRYNDALRLYDRALREGDFVELIHTYRGDALLAAGDTAEACRAWEKAVEEGEAEASFRLEAHCNSSI